MSDTNELRAVKLTKAQREYLQLLQRGARKCAPSYPPAVRLLQDGYAERLPRPAWSGRLISLGITDAGRALLSTSDARAPSVEEGKHG